MVLRKIEDFFRKKTQDVHVVLANGEIGMRGSDEFADEVRPVVGPLLLEDGNEDKVELVYQRPVDGELLL